ncbi:diguanylate cyclase [Phormidium sp. LEGE 05292]|uniref:GGDEF domain-containing response regulator n=1 Tax=[Phormidium] sp. LEGE 05292 TaxID=767427 RepID=UPI00188166C1|nr:diguanylate cyclase [Phormidium sp. LEGE 05292]MBE9224660.1 diguanylate cyclase [Phormidium sp. LEGE 05292]
MSQTRFTTQKNPPAKSGLVFIIGNNANNFDLLSKLLTESRFNVVVAKSTDSAIYKAEYARPDLMILDITEPDFEGIKACQLLKKHKITEDIPLILLSDLAHQAEKIRCLEIGAVDYINKPIQPEEVLVRVRNNITIYQLQKQVNEQNLRIQHQMAIQNLIGIMQERICQSATLDEILKHTVNELRIILRNEQISVYQFEDYSNYTIDFDSINLKDIPRSNTTTKSGRQDNYQETKMGVNTAINSSQNQLQYRGKSQPNLIFPIRQGGKIWGFLIIENLLRKYDEQELEMELLKQLARQIGITIQQAQLYEKLQTVNEELHRLATLDTLTQLANRYWFNIYLSQEWQHLLIEETQGFRFKGNSNCLSLIMCDVDYFKLYNDTYGHLTGDFCLEEVAKAIRETVNRPADLVARYGGEEFAVILPNTNPEMAFDIAEKIRAKVKGLQITHSQSPISQYVTLSLGVSSIVPHQESSPEELIATADRALYRAKQEGRDRTYLL